MYNYVLSLWAMEQKVWPKKQFVKKFPLDTPRDENILSQTIFTHHNFHKISNSEFSPNYNMTLILLYWVPREAKEEC